MTRIPLLPEYRTLTRTPRVGCLFAGERDALDTEFGAAVVDEALGAEPSDSTTELPQTFVDFLTGTRDAVTSVLALPDPLVTWGDLTSAEQNDLDRWTFFRHHGLVMHAPVDAPTELLNDGLQQVIAHLRS